MNRQSPAARSRARRFALQALYQMQMSGCSASEVEQQFEQDYDMKRVDVGYLHELMDGVDREREVLVAVYTPFLERDEAELDPVLRSALLIGAFELVHRIDIPFRVAIDEAVELARQFGGEDSYKLVNSVLDRVSEEHRQPERNRQQES
jgi:N utilization substance protein B